MALSKITTASLSDNAVTTAKITDANITTAKVADTAITTAKITDANITTAKVADDAITTAKVNPAQTDITSVGTLTALTTSGLTITGSSRKIIGFERGALTITTGTGASSYNTYTSTGLPTQYVSSHTVTFTNALNSNNPDIFVYQRDGNNAGHSTIYRMWADNNSTTGFTLIVSDTSTSSSVVVNYIAIESTTS
tara:strand:- start:42 stop:626 length:585 start_codon:yes stop_codon:yes gene_type:complete